MTTFATRYEAACAKDGTLRARRTIDDDGIANAGLAWTVPPLGGLPLGWYWIEDGTREALATLTDDAIAHATLACIRYLALHNWFTDNLCTADEINILGAINHDALIAAVEAVQSRGGKAGGTE
jgi:hypothetical protein